MNLYPHELTIPIDDAMCDEIPDTILMPNDNSQATSDTDDIDIEVDV